MNCVKQYSSKAYQIGTSLNFCSGLVDGVKSSLPKKDPVPILARDVLLGDRRF